MSKLAELKTIELTQTLKTKINKKNSKKEDDLENNEPDEIDDVNLEEFSDEIEGWVIEALKAIGCDTGRSVLKLSAEELERRTDLEKETIEEVRRILQEEFDKGE